MNNCDIYLIGDVIYIEAMFTDPFTAAPVDPTAVTFELQAVGQSVEEYSTGDAPVTHPTVGTYICQFNAIAHSAKYKWRVVSSGQYGVAKQGDFEVASKNTSGT